jgi:hypothetical protein
MQILPLIRHLPPPLSLQPLKLIRFSPYFDRQQTYNITNVRPWAVLDMVYPGWASLEKLAFYHACEFPSAGYQHPEIIREIANQVTIWKKNWKKTQLVMGRFIDVFVIYDNRDIHPKPKTHILEYQQAREIMTCRIYQGSEILEWAAAEKLGVVTDNRYVPLVTASPGLLLEFADQDSPSKIGESWGDRC